MKDEHAASQIPTIPSSAENNGGVAADALLSPEAIDSTVKRLTTLVDRMELEHDLIVTAIENHSDTMQGLSLGQEQLQRTVEALGRKLETIETLLVQALGSAATEQPAAG